MKKKTIQEKGAFRNNLLLSLGIMFFFCVSGAVQAAQSPSPPPPRFQEAEGSNGSIVRDNTTGLEWQRCADGEHWTGSGCSGVFRQWDWYDAVRMTAPGGFRIPTIDELKSLAPYDQNIFPATYAFWSSSPSASYTDGALMLHFLDGKVYSYVKGNRLQVRLVRSGQ